jgi:hypothetical protein
MNEEISNAWFRHYSMGRNDKRVRKLRLHLGIRGYAAYYMLIEILMGKMNKKCSFKDIGLIANEIGVQEYEVRDIVCNYKLFIADDDDCFSISNQSDMVHHSTIPVEEAVTYNPETGVFVWSYSFGRSKKGSIAGTKRKDGYCAIRFNNKGYLLHRLAWKIVNKSNPTGVIDHINHNKSDNRICNLRDVSFIENRRNSLMYSTNKSGYSGVYWSKNDKKWRIGYRIDKKVCYKFFTHIEDAVLFKKSLEKDFGYHKNHGKKIEEIGV